MGLNLANKVWVYAERLYISTHSADEFIQILKGFGINYNNELYEQFKHTKPLYTFMSNEDYAFADFMQTVPTYKYLAILEPIVFDEKVIATKKDNWNYYGEYIKNWYPNLIELLELAEVRIDYTNKKLIYEDKEYEPSTADFLPHSFNDPFLDYIRKEINDGYQRGLYLSVMFLSRKLLEVIFVRLFEVVFPKIVGGEYNADNHNLWFDVRKNAHRNFDTLLDNLKDKALAFHEGKDLILELCGFVKPFKDETNACVHKDYKIPNSKYVNSWRIEHLVNMARRLFKKYCNP